MANYITEDDIEVSLINILKSDELAYNFIQCDSDPGRKEDLRDGTGRTSKKQCVLPEQIKTALYKINPDIPTENIDSVIRELYRDFTGSNMGYCRQTPAGNCIGYDSVLGKLPVLGTDYVF